MAILIHDYFELEERAGKHLKVWKVWHIIIFVLAAVFGTMNYIFLQNTKYMVGDHCVLRAPKIEWETVLVPVHTDVMRINSTEIVGSEAQSTTAVPTSTMAGVTVPGANTSGVAVPGASASGVTVSGASASEVTVSGGSTSGIAKREANYSRVDVANSTGNGTEEREVLDLTNTYFASNQDCQFAEYMPILSAMFALVWTTFFVMCPGGGHARTGLTQPWRILWPALVFALVLVGLTGHSFTQTNRGLREFCSAFYNYTNDTTCSSVNPFLERSWNASWPFGARAVATRAASAGAWVCWAGAATLLVVRCLAAPDFQLVRTGVYLNDPHQKLAPHLVKGRRRAGASPSPNKSARSEPTATTELVTGSADDHSSGTASPAPDAECDSTV